VGFYTGCLGKAHWSFPDDVVDESLAESLVKIAKLLARGSEHTEAEIELWVEHMGPALKTDIASMKRARVTWYAAMQQRGLLPDDPNGMEEFIQSVSPPN
jgi:hypothetical protein